MEIESPSWLISWLSVGKAFFVYELMQTREKEQDDECSAVSVCISDSKKMQSYLGEGQICFYQGPWYDCTYAKQITFVSLKTPNG